jgi:hypothetical protein
MQDVTTRIETPTWMLDDSTRPQLATRGNVLAAAPLKVLSLS